MKEQIFGWLLSNASLGIVPFPNYQHKEFVLTITRLLGDKNVDLVYIINYYLTHFGAIGPQLDSDICKISL